MKDKGFKGLWEMRFLKIVNLEKEGFLFYRHLLKAHREIFEGKEAKNILKGIVRDELKHTRIARVLLKMVRDKKVARGEIDAAGNVGV